MQGTPDDSPFPADLVIQSQLICLIAELTLTAVEQLKVDIGVTLNTETINFARRFFMPLIMIMPAACLCLIASERSLMPL